MAKLDTTFLQSRLAQRIFLLFVLCALIPIAALAVISFGYVSEQLYEQSEKQLHRTTKGVGMAIVERLFFLEEELRLKTRQIENLNDLGSESGPKESSEATEPRFRKFFTWESGRHSNWRSKDFVAPLNLTAESLNHIQSGKPLLTVQTQSELPNRVFMSFLIDFDGHQSKILTGEIEPRYLWPSRDGDVFPESSEFCVLDHMESVLFCSLPGQLAQPGQFHTQLMAAVSGRFDWQVNGQQHRVSFWSFPLQHHFFTPMWTVLVYSPKSQAMAAMSDFRLMFLLVVLMSIWVVLLLSFIQIRKNLVPLEKLQRATKRISESDFHARVDIKSGDEFQQLGQSFNAMARRLGSQFRTLSTMAAIDRAILSTLDISKIIATLFNHMSEVFPYERASFLILDRHRPQDTRMYIAGRNGDRHSFIHESQVAPAEVKALALKAIHIFIDGCQDLPGYLHPMANFGLSAFVTIPVFVRDSLAAVLSLGFKNHPKLSKEDSAQAQQLAEQVGVAIANAWLLHDLAQMSWGTLTALARVIDAKSPWTAGHSERVSRLAIRIGQKMHLSAQQLDSLKRAALIHDIGKISIPADVLDKAGELTDREESLMRQHPETGARILEPILAFSDVVPIVHQHHERFDGSGYPESLTGSSIEVGARILSVADVFDAVISKRPYRAAFTREQAVGLISKGAGRQFDPAVVRAFLALIEEDDRGRNGDE